MALINDPNIAAQIAALAATGQIDTTALVNLINQSLPPGQQLQTGGGVTTGVYKRFGEFDKVNAKVEVVTTGLWSGDTGQLLSFFTSSTQTVLTGDYFYNVYNANPLVDDSAEVQFSLAYGHVNGGGSANLAVDSDSTLASKAIYSQYKSILLEPTDGKFSFEDGSGVAQDSNSIYAIATSRARFREKMDPGNWSLTLTGSLGTFTFIDDSGKKFGDTLGKAGRVFKIVEGSLNLGTENEATINSTTSSNNKGYGSFYPDRGILILNPEAIGSTIGTIRPFGVATNLNLSGSISTAADQQNHKLLFQAIVNGGYASGDSNGFDARRTENVSTQHFFVRATNREFNYSNNPTFVNADGTFAEPSFEADPTTYITTIGLYNDANELISVAKISEPLAKSFDREVLIKIKLSF